MIEVGTRPDSQKQKLIISIPTHQMVPYQFAVDFANMVGYTIAMLGDQLDVMTNVVAGTYVHKAREQLVKSGLEQGFHWMLWLDSDMRFPRDLVPRLMSHNKDFVGINYATRQIPSRFVAIKRTTLDHPDDGLNLYTGEESTGLEEVEAVGFGAVLMKGSALANLPPDKLWFWYEWHQDRNVFVGEDVYFCRMLRQSGVKIYVDHDLSKDCAHVGDMEYLTRHAAVQWEEDHADGDNELHGVTDGGGELAEPERSDQPDP